MNINIFPIVQVSQMRIFVEDKKKISKRLLKRLTYATDILTLSHKDKSLSIVDNHNVSFHRQSTQIVMQGSGIAFVTVIGHYIVLSWYFLLPMTEVPP